MVLAKKIGLAIVMTFDVLCTSISIHINWKILMFLAGSLLKGTTYTF